ncbi:MAG TPA: hypothetical protein VGN57_07655 [Pirellulaceae bacterium]|jgi:hypothetical protein|nr:hypothetical protein [Pirellulaceae bacterium]
MERAGNEAVDTYRGALRLRRVYWALGGAVGGAIYLFGQGGPNEGSALRTSVAVILYVVTGASAAYGVLCVLGGLQILGMTWLILGRRFGRGMTLTRYCYRRTPVGLATLEQTRYFVAALFALCFVGWQWGFEWTLWALIPVAVLVYGAMRHVNVPPVGVFLTSSTDASFHLFDRLHTVCSPVRIVALLRPDAASTDAAFASTAHDNWRTGGKLDWRDVVDDMTSFVNAVIVDARFDTEHIRWEIEKLAAKGLLRRSVFIVEPGSKAGALHSLAASRAVTLDTLLQVATEDEALEAARSLIMRRSAPSPADEWVLPPVRLREFA